MNSVGRAALEGLLQSTEPNLGWDDQRLRSLHQQLTSQLRNTTFGLSKYDAVLSVMLDIHEGREPSQESLNAAYHLLCNDLERYQVVFGNQLPSRLFSEAQMARASKAFDHGTGETLDDDWEEYLRRLSMGRATSYFPTGITEVDHSLGGGLAGLTFIVGDKGVGKTSFLLNTMHESLRANESTSVLYFSFDFRKSRVMSRLVSLLTGVDSRAVRDIARNGDPAGMIGDSIPRSIRRRIKIIERDFSQVGVGNTGETTRVVLTAVSLASEVSRLMRASDTTRVLVVVDPFQKIIVPTAVGVSEEDKYRLDVFDEAAQRVQRSHGEGSVCFLVASEMRKRESNRLNKAPTIDDIKGDGRMASDADTVLSIHTDRMVDNDTNDVCVGIAKGREGVTRGEHRLRFRHRIERFESVNAENAPVTTAVSTATSSHPNPFEE